MARTVRIKKYMESAVELPEVYISNIIKSLTKLLARIDKYKDADEKKLAEVYEREFRGHEFCLINIGWEVEIYESS